MTPGFVGGPPYVRAHEVEEVMNAQTYEIHAHHVDDHAELVQAAERERLTTHMARARRVERWARRSARLSAYLSRLARVQQARLS
jgi:hypothetical protein